MGIDTTPDSNEPEPGSQDEAPRWFLVLVLVIVVAGGLWVLMTIFKSGTV